MPESVPDGSQHTGEGDNGQREPVCKETVCPVRVLTSTVLGAETGGWVLVPVRSRNAIPLKQHMEIMDVLKKVRIDHSVEMGDVVLPNAKGSGEDIIACAPSRVCSFLYSISN